jgi:queuosine precursor transporter
LVDAKDGFTAGTHFTAYYCRLAVVPAGEYRAVYLADVLCFFKRTKPSTPLDVYFQHNSFYLSTYFFLFMIKQIISDKPTRLFIILGGFFIANALIAEIIGVKIFSLEKTLGFTPMELNLFGNLLSVNLTAGVLLWPVVFIMTDIINEYYGMKGVRFLSYLTAGLIAFAFIIFLLAMKLTPADFFISSKQGSGVPDMEKAYNSVLGQGGFIIIGSLTAFILGQLIDVFVFHKIKKVTGENRIWLRATGSTLVSQFIDSFVVLFIAFYVGTRVNQQANDFVWPFSLFIAVGIVNYIYKFIVAILLTPVIYLVHNLIEKFLGQERAAEMKKAAMANE